MSFYTHVNEFKMRLGAIDMPFSKRSRCVCILILRGDAMHSINILEVGGLTIMGSSWFLCDEIKSVTTISSDDCE